MDKNPTTLTLQQALDRDGMPDAEIPIPLTGTEVLLENIGKELGQIKLALHRIANILSRYETERTNT